MILQCLLIHCTQVLCCFFIFCACFLIRKKSEKAWHSAFCKGDDGALTYNEAADTCDAVRRLSARRRSGGWSSSRRSSSWSSSRRRAPSAPATSPRRRSWMAPSGTSARRRAPPPPSIRRRAPPPPVPSPLESRRRTTSLSGNTYVTTPRRRYMGMGSHLAAVTCDHTDNKFVDIDGQNVKLFIVSTPLSS